MKSLHDRVLSWVLDQGRPVYVEEVAAQFGISFWEANDIVDELLIAGRLDW